MIHFLQKKKEISTWMRISFSASLFALITLLIWKVISLFLLYLISGVYSLVSDFYFSITLTSVLYLLISFPFFIAYIVKENYVYCKNKKNKFHQEVVKSIFLGICLFLIIFLFYLHLSAIFNFLIQK